MISRELLRYLEFGYEEFLYADLKPRQIREYMLSYVKELQDKERENIMKAFLAGWNYRGQCDEPKILASLYFEITHGDKLK